MNRRQFLTTLTTAISALAITNLLPKGLVPTANAADTDLPMVNTKDTMAGALKYVEDAKKAPAAKGNSCKSCQLYTAKGKKNGKNVGVCSIFAGKMVYENAYCNSYSKKA